MLAHALAASFVACTALPGLAEYIHSLHIFWHASLACMMDHTHKSLWLMRCWYLPWLLIAAA